MLLGKKIVLCVSGGIAAYKSATLVRLLKKQHADVHVVMTSSATEFITPLTFQTLSQNPVRTGLFEKMYSDELLHISLSCADAFVIAPATANIVGKIANGIADDLVTTAIMATKAPVIIAPAMNCNMYSNPIYKENESKLSKMGYHFVDPSSGSLACGVSADGRMQNPEIILEEIIFRLYKKDMSKHTVLVTAGPTIEHLDPFRYISNPSSGKMGYAFARIARLRGARVILISGKTHISPPDGVETHFVTSSEEMYEAAKSKINDASILIKAAAVSDYRPKQFSEQKIKKDGKDTSIEIEPCKDILFELSKNKKNHQLFVGFAAETNNLLEYAKEKLRNKNLDYIIANDISKKEIGFGSDNNKIYLIDSNENISDIPNLSKTEIADKVFDIILPQ